MKKTIAIVSLASSLVSAVEKPGVHHFFHRVFHKTARATVHVATVGKK